MKQSILGYIFLSGLLMAPLAYADNGGNFSNGQSTSSGQHQKWEHRHGKLGKMHLTDDQRKQLKAIRQKQHEDMKAGMVQMKAAKQALRQELLKPQPDVAKITQLQTTLKTLQAQKSDNKLNALLEEKKILDPEQFAKLLAKEKGHGSKGRCSK